MVISVLNVRQTDTKPVIHYCVCIFDSLMQHVSAYREAIVRRIRHKGIILYVISGLHCDVHEICALLGCYGAYSSNSLPTFRHRSWNVGKELPLYAVQYPRREQISNYCVICMTLFNVIHVCDCLLYDDGQHASKKVGSCDSVRVSAINCTQATGLKVGLSCD